MGQRNWTEEEQRAWKTFYPALFKAGRDSFAGFPTARVQQGLFDVPAEEREAWFENLWQRGGFNFGLGNYVCLNSLKYKTNANPFDGC